MKIAFFEVPKSEQEIFSSYFKGQNVSFFEEKLEIDNINLAKDFDVISIFVNTEVKKELIDSLPNLKYLTTRSTGFDHIDVEYCKSKNIKVSNVPAYGSHTVAEFAFALLLNLSRKVYDAYHNLREGADFSIFNLRGFDLFDKTFGVIGTGRIGKNSIKIAKGFGMDVIAYDLHPDLEFAKENNFEYKTFDEVISNSDVITLHAPFCKENCHIINKEVISKMKKGVYLINTARGELIDTEALIWGLDQKIIAGAGLDVLEGERELKEEFEILAHQYKGNKIIDYKKLFEDKVLIDLPNVIVTPHIAFYSKEAEHEIIKTTEENIKNFIDNKPQNLVN
jgi:D-lactate dehydrogenase